MAVHVETVNAPANTTAALIEPRIVTAEDVHSSDTPEAFHRLVIARTVCHWSATYKSSMVEISNQSNRHVYLERNTMLGDISPVETVPQANVSILQNVKNHRIPHERNSNVLWRKLEEQQHFHQTDVHNYFVCAKYRSVSR